MIQECGSLNVFDTHNFTVGGTIRRSDFVKVAMALLEEVCHCGVDFEFSYAQDTTQCVS